MTDRTDTERFAWLRLHADSLDQLRGDEEVWQVWSLEYGNQPPGKTPEQAIDNAIDAYEQHDPEPEYRGPDESESLMGRLERLSDQWEEQHPEEKP
jgi:hypothetical protein